MNKPRWQDVRDDLCQWPRCNVEGGVHYSYKATKWIDVEDGVWLCDKHQKEMSEALFPELELPFDLGSEVHIAAFEDYPREAVHVIDWYVEGSEIHLLVSDNPKELPDDCEAVPLSLIEET